MNTKEKDRRVYDNVEAALWATLLAFVVYFIVFTLNSPYFVNFDYWAKGIKVRGSPYPIVRMDWAQGDTLNLF